MICLESLSRMPNIGSALEKKLIDVEIRTPEALIRLGSREAFMRIKALDNTACYNLLCALEGAVQGIRWHNLPETTKKDLKCFFQSLK
jgi:DNA transformation protein and related proteins